MKNVLFSKIKIFFLVGVLFFSVISFSIAAKPVEAASENPKGTTERWLMYRGMWACLEDGLDNSELSRSDVEKGHWSVVNDKEGFGYLAPDMDGGDDGTVDCNDGSIWVRGATAFGFSSPVQLLCAINRGLEAKGDGSRLTPNNSNDCEKSTYFDAVANGDWQAALTWALDNEGSKNRPKFHINDNADSKSMLYLIGKTSLETFCGGGVPLANGIDDLTNDKYHVSVHVVDPATGNVKKSQLYKLADGNDQDSLFDDVYYNQGGNSNEAIDRRCHEMAKMTRDNAEAYGTWAEANKTAAEDNEAATGSGAGSDDIKPSCDSEGGPGAWFLCMILEVMDRFIAFLDRQISSLLFIDKDVFDNGTIDAAWSSMRNLALLILVPMMMFMVIGTALNFGPFDPYTVKKALPRMFIAVIFIVISLPLTQFAIQLSNVAGQGLGNIIIGASPNSVQYLSDIFSDAGGGSQETLGWAAIVGGLGGFAIGGIGALLSFGLVAIVALLIGFLTLLIRQVLLIMLIVIAPLAILVWIFPGNDKLWNLWKGTVLAMLLMYPIIAVLLATGKFVAGILG